MTILFELFFDLFFLTGPFTSQEQLDGRESWGFYEFHSFSKIYPLSSKMVLERDSCPSFVQAWACLSLNWLVERSRAYRSFRLKFLSVRPSVRPSWTKIKPSDIWRKSHQEVRREPENLLTNASRGWSEPKATWTHGLDGRLHSSSYVQYWWKSKRKQICRKSRKSEQTDEQHWHWKELLHSNYKHL